MALSARDRMVLLRIKIERAKHHLRELEAAIIPAQNVGRNVLLPVEDAVSGQITQQLKWVKIYPFDVLAIAGDVVHALRSALDHLAYQLCIAGSDQTPSRRVEFPIAKDLPTYEAEKAKKMQGIRPEAVDAIDALKPYRGGNDILWRLHELDNIDKHRFVFTIGDDTLFVGTWFDGEFLLRPRGLKSDAPLFSGVFDADLDNDVNFELAEAFTQPQIAEGRALIPSLRQWVNYVEDVILKFERFMEPAL